mgnify:CR=1 FL=1
MITRDDRNEEPSVAERVIARERVLLDREIELYRLRHLAEPVRFPRQRRAESAQDRADARQLGR